MSFLDMYQLKASKNVFEIYKGNQQLEYFEENINTRATENYGKPLL